MKNVAVKSLKYPKQNRSFMQKSILICVILFILALIGARTAFCDISVGVETGDWIEYSVTFSGSPPAGHEVTWARSEVTGVQGKVINLNITTEFSNGTMLKESITLNLETGQLGDDFIIPSNLKEGDTFSDTYHGVMTISALNEKNYAGATRKVVSATTAGNLYYWDQTTGILLEGISQFPEYSIHSIANRTNIWEPQILGLPSTIFYLTLAILGIVVVLVVTSRVLRKKK